MLSSENVVGEEVLVDTQNDWENPSNSSFEFNNCSIPAQFILLLTAATRVDLL